VKGIPYKWHKLLCFKVVKLEKFFETQKYVTSNEREELARTLELTPTQVKVGFPPFPNKVPTLIFRFGFRTDDTR
jgi:hypothetical protein